MMPMAKLLLLSTAVSLVFVGCTSTNPKAAFDDVSKTVAARTGEEVRWLREDSQSGEIERAVEGLLKTNLTAQSAIAIARLNTSKSRSFALRMKCCGSQTKRRRRFTPCKRASNSRSGWRR